MNVRPRNAGIKNIFAVLASALDAIPGLVSVFALPLSSSIVGITDINGNHIKLNPSKKKSEKIVSGKTTHRSILA
jgi:hypothetical protein